VSATGLPGGSVGPIGPRALRLNIGCGPLPLHMQHIQVMNSYGPFEEWLFVDKHVPSSASTAIRNWDARAIPLVPGTVDTIYSSHLLEHLPARAVAPALAHWRALLKPGGVLHLNVPDLEWACERFLRLLLHERGRASQPDAPLYFNSAIDYAGDRSMLAVFYGTQSHEGEHHHTGFTRESLRQLLHASRFHVDRVEQVVEAHDMGCLIAIAKVPT
jgi:predicted SAM-dependent methyltransferase